MDTLEQCQDLVSQIQTALKQQRDRLWAIDVQLETLEEEGVFDAIPSLSWEGRNGGEKKYLRLVFPTEHGRRRRQYIGSDPDKIEAAKEQVARTEQVANLDAERRRITNHVLRARTQLRRALNALEDKTVW